MIFIEYYEDILYMLIKNVSYYSILNISKCVNIKNNIKNKFKRF